MAGSVAAASGWVMGSTYASNNLKQAMQNTQERILAD